MPSHAHVLYTRFGIPRMHPLQDMPCAEAVQQSECDHAGASPVTVQEVPGCTFITLMCHVSWCHVS